MNFWTVYRRVLGLLAPERTLVVWLAVANIALATLPFLEPLLFGRVVDTLAGSAGRPAADVWADALVLPACMDPHRPALIKGLRGVVDGYLAFLQDVNLGRLVAQAAMDDGRSALQAFRLELSSCRAAVARP